MRKLAKRDKRAILLGGILIALYLLIFHLVMPVYEAQADVATNFERETKFLEKAMHTLQQKDAYVAQLDDINTVLGEYEDRLLSSRDSSSAAVELEEIVRAAAAENRISLTKTSPLPEKKIGERYSKVTLQLNVDGDMTATTGFLYSLSSHHKFLLVEDFAISKFRNQPIVQPRMSVSGYIKLS